VAILASETDKEIDPRLAEIATEVRKWDKSLTGFRLDRTTTYDVAPGKKEIFPLVEDAVLSVQVKPRLERDGRVEMTIKPPHLGYITYSCRCGKFFPVVTRYFTRDKERLIVAVMVKPCKTGKDKP
jgi:hypothetical protein